MKLKKGLAFITNLKKKTIPMSGHEYKCAKGRWDNENAYSLENY